MSGAQVILGDCLQVMRQFPDGHFDLVLTDPPYGTTALAFDQARIDWPAWWAEVHRVAKHNAVIVCFAADLFTVDLIQSNRKHYRYRLVWEKTMPTGFLDANARPLRAHEDILIFSRRGTVGTNKNRPTYNPQKTPGEAYGDKGVRQARHYRDDLGNIEREGSDGGRHPKTVIKFSNGNRGNEHPTQKPLDLMAWLVRTYSNPGDLILDPFMGSGSTGAAAIQEGRRFIGIELDEKYHAIAQRRVQNAIPPLLDAPLVVQ